MTLPELIRLDRGRRENTERLRRFIETSEIGEGYVNWRGPIPEDTAQLKTVSTQLERQYTSRNILARICEDHVNAVVGKEVTWEIDPLVEEANAALTEWFKRQKVQELVQKALYTLMYVRVENEESKLSEDTSSIVRMFIPGRAVRDGRADFKTLKEALLGGVRPMHPKPGSAGMLKDIDGETIGGYYCYTDVDPGTNIPRRMVEVVALDTEIVAQEWGFSEENENHVPDEQDPLTVIQQRDELSGQILSEIMYPFGGLLTIFEMEQAAFVDDSMLLQQMAMNLNETVMQMSTADVHFLERLIFNAQIPGKKVKDPVTNEEKFVPEPFSTGPGKTNVLQGVARKNEQGQTIGYETPGVYYHDPTGPGVFIESAEYHEKTLYDLARMNHVLISGDATASGISRQQAVQRFILSLNPTKAQAKALVEWLIKLALSMGTYLAGQPNVYRDTAVDPRITITAVQPTPDEVRVGIELYNAGAISLADLMRRSGVDDEKIMAQQIADEQAAQPEPEPAVQQVEKATQ